MTQPSEYSQPAAPGGSGRLILHVRDKDGIFGVEKDAQPVAQLGDSPISIGWGRNELDLPAGDYRMSLSVRRRGTGYGTAQSGVSIRAGQQVELFYAPPVWKVIGGRIGAGEQHFPGRVLQAALLALFALVIVGVLVLVLVLLLT